MARLIQGISALLTAGMIAPDQLDELTADAMLISFAGLAPPTN